MPRAGQFTGATKSQVKVMTQSRSRGSAASNALPIATVAAAIAIFIADTVTDLDVAFAVLYVVIVLMAARFLSARGVVLVAAGCVVLTVVSYWLTPPSGPEVGGIANTLISLVAILLTT